MADARQFGGGKIRQFGDLTGGNLPGASDDCAQCEAMLTDALDGTLSAADQEFFDLHVAHCGPCAQLLAEARRGAAFLEVLRWPAPEPPADLVERILAETSTPETHAIGQMLPAPPTHVLAGHAGVSGFGHGGGHMVAFPRGWVGTLRRSSFGQILLQPRLAMTAAMAFFSLALTMNLTGFHPLSLRASDLKPSSLRRGFYSANARVEQYYESLRFAYELESRVHELKTAADTEQAQPTVETPAAAPAKAPAPAAAPAGKRDAKPGQSSGSSRREEPGAERVRAKVVVAADAISARRYQALRTGRKVV